jgi:hypothetical protein
LARFVVDMVDHLDMGGILGEYAGKGTTTRRCWWPCYLWLCDGDIRKEKEQRTGNKPGGRPPKAPSAEPKDKDQVSLTDEDSRIMPSHDVFVQSYNAQASVDAETHLIVEQHITQQPNDKREVAPAVERLQQLPEVLGQADELLADTGYFSEGNVRTCESNGIAPCIPEGRQGHNEPLHERFADDPPAPGHPALSRPCAIG